ncbi:MAG: hypothetical protein ACXVZU_01130 [Methanobacteriaceae archaeon]
MGSSDKPDHISLTAEQVVILKNEIQSTNLSPESKKIFISLLSSCLWLHSKLAAATITISQLKKIFGIPTTEKKSLL